MKNIKHILAGVIIGLAFIALVFIPFGHLAEASPPAAPTPVADFLVGSVQPASVIFQAATALSVDTNTTGVEAMRFGAVDIQYTIDQTATGEVNTNTLKVQYSNDNSNWVDGLTLASANAADVTSITRVPVFGRYMRINQDITLTTIPVTITLLAVGR